MDRRKFLRLAGSSAALAAASPALGAWNPAGAAELGAFRHGVASGDPLADALIIWTRVTPTPEATPGSGLGPETAVTYEVATDPDFAALVTSGSVLASTATDHTVKLDVTGLLPATTYFYRFGVPGQLSPVGRMRTAPATTADLQRLRFGMVSCSNWTGGYFRAYFHLAQRNDLDFVLHLGDYIYEYGNGSDRYGPSGLVGKRDHVPPVEMVSLSDYRQRHAQYKTDGDLQMLHARYAWIVTLDDHEVTNDTYDSGAQNHNAGEGDYAERRARAYQAYLEYMPLRQPDPADPLRIYRRLRFGTLADVTMLDLRQYRSEQTSNTVDPANDSPDRTITGDAQIEFFKTGLAGSAAQWKLVGNSVMFAPVRQPPGPTFFNSDQWNGYRADRTEVLDVIDGKVNDVVFLTGDIHSGWAIDTPRDPNTYPLVSPSLATEFVCTSVTSDNLNEITETSPARSSIPAEQGFIANNAFIKYLNFDDHGYSVVDVNRQRLQVDYFILLPSAGGNPDARQDPQAQQRRETGFQTVTGSNAVSPATAAIIDDGVAGPAPVVPEVPIAAMLPGTALALLGAAYLYRRRLDNEEPEPSHAP